MTDDLDQMLDDRGGTPGHLLDLVDLKKVDRLVEALDKCAMKDRPITTVEVIRGARSRPLCSKGKPGQRMAVCAGIAAYTVGSEIEEPQ